MQGGTASFEVRLGVAIPMSDGVSLNADLYLPREAGPQPCLFKMTPYTTDFSHKSASGFARHGFAVCVVDVRGRGGSGGVVDPYNEGQDGADCVAWIARQPWCDGRRGLPRSSGPVSVLVHDGFWRYGRCGRRSGSGWRSRPLDDLGSWRAIPQ